MPVKMDGETFDDHDAAVAHLKRTKPSIADPDAYVATVERAEKTASYSMCKDCDFKPSGEASLQKHSEYTGHTIMSKGEKIASLLIGKEVSDDYIKNMDNDGIYTKEQAKFNKSKQKDDRLDENGKQKDSFTLLEKGEYGIGKKYKGASHPFNKMAALYKLQILSRVKGAQYVPHDSDPIYENLDVESRQGIDNLFNKEKVGILYTKLGKLEFTGSASAAPKKTGADVEKEKEKIPKGTTNPFDFLGAKIREAVMSDFEYKETSVKQTGWGGKVNNPGPVSVKEPKKDPEEFSGGLSAKSTTCPTCGYYPVRDQKLHDKIIHSDN